MNLLQIRTQFVRQSGRHDLVDAVYNDNGADFFIQAGQRYLDRLHTYEMATQRLSPVLSQGDHYIDLDYVRSIKKIWVINSNEVRQELTEKTYRWLAKKYANPENMDEGLPLYYAIDPAFTSGLQTRVYILPPPDEDMDLDIEGLFYAYPLENNSDTNYWSEMFPNVLVMAGLRELEVFYRNTQGVQDWENAIQLEMRAFQFDLVEREIANTTQMEG